MSDSLRHGDDDVFVIARVGNGIRASEALAAGLWAFLRYRTKGEECVILAVSVGGDTDTVGAMAGALVGVLQGSDWIPARRHDHIENGVHGREEIVALARRLARLDVRNNVFGERGSASALAPHTYLHVWWARRPLTASRAAILASLLPADFPRDTFERLLGFGRSSQELVQVRQLMDTG